MMSSCCTLRLKRRKAFSRDSLSWMMTSATLYSPPIRFGLVSCGVTISGAPPLEIIACWMPRLHVEVGMLMPLLINLAIGVKQSFGGEGDLGQSLRWG